MAKRHVQVVLKQNIDTLGESGKVAKVRPGYARNYLIPRGLAVIASRENVKQIEHEKKLALQRLERLKAEALERAKIYEGVVLHVAKQVADADTGKLFGSVTVADILEAFEVRGIKDVDKRSIVLPEDGIKVTGSYEIHLKVGAGVQIPVKLEVKTAS
ncbi:MAG: 50S ribosomal protein L9 [Myxococcales bacterium]|nr:50S ribosomal protein L9 [Myxococcales bacterium]